MQHESQEAHEELGKTVEERTAELEGKEREALLIHQSRLATMGEMIDSIAHQWRQPLNALGLIVQELPLLMERRELTDQYLAEKLGKAKDLIFHMSETISDFRYFFRPTVERELFNTAGLIARALNLVHDTLKEDHIEVEVEAIGAPAVHGCANELSQVLLNILLNSRDAFLELKGSQVRTIRIRTFCENGRTIITVADNAGGIAEENIGRIFDQYFTTKGPDKGTGIGLFIAKIIVEKHIGGSFTVRNAGSGAEFRIELESK